MSQPAQYRSDVGDRWPEKLNANLDALWNFDAAAATLINSWVGIQSYQVATYINSTQFSVPNDLTSKYAPTRLLLLDLGTDGAKFNTVVSSSYGGGITTVVVTRANLTSNLAHVLVLSGSTSDIVSAADYGFTQAGLEEADAVALAAGKLLVLGPGTWPLTSAKTFAANWQVMPGATIEVDDNITVFNYAALPGSLLEIATAKTVTISNALDAGPYQIFSCAGTGKVVFGDEAIKEAFCEWWGGKSDDSTDNYAALQAAFIAYPVVRSLDGIYQVDGTDPLYLNNASAAHSYIWRGNGRKTKIDFRGYADDTFCIKLNEDATGARVVAYPAYPRLVLQDMCLDATNSTTPDFMKVNQCAVVFDRLRFDKFDHGVVTGSNSPTDVPYSDSNRVTAIFWAAGTSAGYFYDQQGYGDNTVLEQVRTVNNTSADMDCGLARIQGNQNAGTSNISIRNCTAGRIYLNKAEGVVIDGLHGEGVGAGDRNLTVIDSEMTLRNSTIWNNNDGATAPILIQATGRNPSVILENNLFTSRLYDRGQAAADLHFEIDQTYYSVKAMLRNNRRSVGAGDGATNYYFGITATAAGAGVATLNTVLGTHKRLLSGDVEINKRNSHYIILPVNLEHTKLPRIGTNPSLSVPAEISTVLSNLPDSTYYYAMAYIVSDSAGYGMHSVTSPEQSINMSAANKAVLMQVGMGLPYVIARIWRGTSAGVYDRYVDIPLAMSDAYVMDCGDHISGFAWITSGVPFPPTVNTAFEGIEWNGQFRTFYSVATMSHGAFAAVLGDDIINVTPAAGSPDGWRVVSAVNTTMRVQAVAAATTMEVDDTTGILAADIIGIKLDNGLIHSTTVASVTDGDTLVITAPIPASRTADIGAAVRTYRTKAKANLAA